jgi:tetratricopeptide (TPR) repeat protein
MDCILTSDEELSTKISKLKFLFKDLCTKKEEYIHDVAYSSKRLIRKDYENIGFVFDDILKIYDESGGFNCLCEIFNYKPPKDDFKLASLKLFAIDFLSKAIIMIPSKSNMDQNNLELVDEHVKVNHKLIKQLFENGFLKNVVNHFKSKQCNFLEKWNILTLLSHVCYHEDSAKFLIESDLAPEIYYHFRESVNVLFSYFDSNSFKDEEKYFLSLNQGNLYSGGEEILNYSEQSSIDEMSQYDCYVRASRFHEIIDSTGVIISVFANFPTGRDALSKLGVIDQFFEKLNEPFHYPSYETVLHGNIWNTFANFIKDEKFADLLISKGLIDVLSEWCLSPYMGLCICVFTAVLSLCESPKKYKMLVVNNKLIVNTLSMKSRHASVNIMTIAFRCFIELSKEKESLAVLLTLPKYLIEFSLECFQKQPSCKVLKETLEKESGKSYSRVKLSEPEIQVAIQTAAALKKQGNDFFKVEKYDNAVECYTNALEIIPTHGHYEKNDFHLILSNRAECYLKLHRYEEALMDTVLSLGEEPELREKTLLRFVKAAKNTGHIINAYNTSNMIQLENPKMNLTHFINELTNDFPFPKLCSYCSKPALKLKKCTCLKVKYCGTECQSKHWKLHKQQYHNK